MTQLTFFFASLPVVNVLVACDEFSSELKKDGKRSNHPVIDENLATLQRDIVLA